MKLFLEHLLNLFAKHSGNLYLKFLGMLRAQTWPRDPSGSIGLVLLCRLHRKSASQISSKVVLWPKTNNTFLVSYIECQ